MMTTPPEIILQTLEELGKEEFDKFKWCLYQKGVLGDFPSIPKSHLEDPNKTNTVDQMVQTYNTSAIKVTEMVLKKIKRNDLVSKISRTINEGASEVKLQPNTADTEPDPKRMKTPSTFTPEMQTESSQISYRFRFTGPGMFKCAKTGVVFDMAKGAKLQYSIVQWDENRLKPTGKEAAGPLYDIRSSEDAAVHQLHFPHCETKDALRTDHLLSVANSTGDKMNILEPLRITGTHVVMDVTQRSLFSFIWGPVKKWLSTPVKGQVLLFLRPPLRGPRTLDVFLLQKNVPVSQVAAQQENAEYIKIQGNCSLISGRSYSLHCEQEGLKIQPECANFNPDFGPDFHPTFEVFLMTNPDKVTLIIQDQEETEVWKRVVHLKDPVRDTEQRVQPQRVQPHDWLSSVWTQLIDRLSEVNVYQILDRLLQQEVFNAQEMEFIRAQIGADKAWKLLEGVQQKGPKAISLLKDALREVDPFLFGNLNLP